MDGGAGWIDLTGAYRYELSGAWPYEVAGGDFKLAVVDGGIGHDIRDGDIMALLAMLMPPSEPWLERWLDHVGDGALGYSPLSERGEMRR